MALALVSLPSCSATAVPAGSRRRHAVVAQAAGSRDGPYFPTNDPFGGEESKNAALRDSAAANFAKGLEAGMSADDVVAAQLGAASSKQLSATQQKYKDKIKATLQQRAEELKAEKEARALEFAQGKRAYERGQYAASVALFEKALNEEGPFSLLGGEIQLWLALGYQACGREEDCIQTYKMLEKTHPVPSIRRQAKELCYIMEAPKLQLSPDERVQIPVLTDLDPNKGGRAPAPRPRPQRRERPKTWDEQFWENWQPPVYVKNKYVQAAAAVLALGLALWSAQLHP